MKDDETGRGRARVIGSYAAEPRMPGDRPGFARSVLALPGVSGLEIPFGAAVYEEDLPWLWEALPRGGRHVVTLIAATMETLRTDPGFGLASTDQEGRRRALKLLARARTMVERAVAQGHGIVAVEVHSAPSQDASRSAFLQSLEEASDWEWSGAALVVEHCDARHAGRPYAKGFLELDEELDVVQEVDSVGRPTPVGIALNWGRSAIDARSAAGAVDQIRRARSRGLLRGLILSGASGESSAYGQPWQDSHVPAAALDLSVGEPSSLLTSGQIVTACEEAGNELWFDGVKVSVRPDDASPVRRVAHIARVLASMP